MKRFISLLLCLIMVFTLVGCTKTGQEDTQSSTLLVGFGRTDITPQFSVRLGGYGGSESRWSDNVLDPLYATAMAFTDAEGNTVITIQLDMCTTSTSEIPFIRKKISKQHDISIDNIYVYATHSHSTPRIQGDEPAIVKYKEYMEEQMLAAVEAALADRKPAEMYTATTTVNYVNFVRHYRMDDGSVVGDNFGDDTGKTYVKHVKDADNSMQLVRFKREGGKDILLVNWQCHPIRTGGGTKLDISSDIVGSMRMALEPQMDCYMVYYTGAGGNLDPYSSITQENITDDYIEQGNLMAQAAIWACDNMTKRDTGKVQSLRRDQLKGGDNANGFLSYAFSIGDVAFITAAYEMFDTNGVFIKENSPYDMTFVVTMANGVAGYVPAEWAYEYGENVVAYEVATGGHAKGTAETLANGFVEMLTELYPTRK